MRVFVEKIGLLYFLLVSFNNILSNSVTRGHVLIVSPAVNGLKKTNNDDGSVTLTWEVPNGFNATEARYVVAYEGETYTLPITQTEFVVPSGKEKKTFNVKVRI